MRPSLMLAHRFLDFSSQSHFQQALIAHKFTIPIGSEDDCGYQV